MVSAFITRQGDKDPHADGVFDCVYLLLCLVADCLSGVCRVIQIKQKDRKFVSAGDIMEGRAACFSSIGLTYGNERNALWDVFRSATETVSLLDNFAKVELNRSGSAETERSSRYSFSSRGGFPCESIPYPTAGASRR